MIAGAFPATLGLATKSGWMTSEQFPQVMQHFIKHSESTKENPTLLLMDNHESHLSIEALQLAKDNGETILTFPPHTTHRLQPLDVSLTAPFKTQYSTAVNNWLRTNPGKTFSIYDVAGCVNEAYCKAMTPANILSGFKKTGISPYNPDVFTDDEFLPSSVTDRPQPEEVHVSVGDVTMTAALTQSYSPTAPEAVRITSTSSPTVADTVPGTSTSSPAEDTASTLTTSAEFVGPETFRGYPKAGPRQNKQRREKGRSLVATDTPEKNQLEAKKLAAEAKKKPKQQEKVKRTLQEDFDEPPAKVPKVSPKNFGKLERELAEGDYVIVELQESRSKYKQYFIAKVLAEEDDDGDVEVSYLKKSNKVSGKFVVPPTPEINSEPLTDIKFIFPKPTFSETKRQQSLHNFGVDLSLLKMG